MGVNMQNLSLKNRFENVGIYKEDFIAPNKEKFDSIVKQYCKEAFDALKNEGIYSINSFDYLIV